MADFRGVHCFLLNKEMQMEMSSDYLFEVALPDGHKPQVLVIPMEKRTASAKGLNQQ